MSGVAPVGVVGLGAMGAPIAERLRAAGRSLVVCDADPAALREVVAAGARAAATPRAVADQAATVLVSLPHPDAVREVALGDDGLVHGTAISTYVDLSTTGPEMAETVAAGLGAAGIAVVDAPLSGGPAGARAGRLTAMVAGSEQAVEAVRPLLESFAARSYRVGSAPGQGQAAKVINNLMSATAIAITAEAMLLGRRAGLDPARLLEVIDSSSGQNNAASDKFPKQVLTRRFAHGFRLSLMSKDVGLALSEARRHRVPMLLGATVGELWGLADERLPGEDCTAIARMFEEWAGTEIAPAT